MVFKRVRTQLMNMTRKTNIGRFVLILLAFLSADGKEVVKDVDPALSLAYGPGLNPRLVYPARYFYVQAVNSDSMNLTSSPGNIFTVGITGLSSNRCSVWTQVLDRHDGSFIVRYRMMETCDGIRIQIRIGDKHVADSPYDFRDWIYHEECYCPVQNAISWQDQMECATSYRQIERDLDPFLKITMASVVESALERFNHAGSHSFCNYVVLNNEIFRKCHGQHVGFKMFVDNILLSLTRKLKLSDLDFIVNLGDWPLVKKGTDPQIPMFSWCGSDDSFDIVMPTYDITESTLEAMGRVSLDMMSVQSNTGPSWTEKIEKGFWRGRDSRRERLQLVYLSKKRPHLVNASLTNFFFFQELEEEYGPKVKHTSFFDFFQYKYQISIDGTVAAYRMPYLLAGDAVIFKQDSQYYEHFYGDLEPMVHYVPFKDVLNDLSDKLEWAKRNDDTVRRIALDGQSYARDNLMPKDILCYYVALFENYAKRLESQVRVRGGMELVTQGNDEKSQCDCNRDDYGIRDEL